MIGANNIFVDPLECNDFFISFDRVFLVPLDKTSLDYESGLECGRGILSYQVLIYASNAKQVADLENYLNTYQNHIFMNHRVNFEQIENIIYDISIKAYFSTPSGSLGDPLAYNFFIKNFADVESFEIFISTVNFKMAKAPTEEFIYFLISEFWGRSSCSV